MKITFIKLSSAINLCIVQVSQEFPKAIRISFQSLAPLNLIVRNSDEVGN